DLGDRPAARGVEHRLPKGGVVVERDLLVREPAGVEERLRAHAEAAPVRRIDLDPGHSPLQRISRARCSCPVPSLDCKRHGRTGGAEAMLRLFSEEEANERAFTALTRFLDLLDNAPHAADRPTLDPLGLAFQLKLLWLAGYLPHVTACAECGAEREPLVGYSPRSGGGVCERCAPATEALALAPDGS